MSAYDIIGDIHGHYKPLKQLLSHLGYKHDGDCYRHSDRKVIYLGDFIDRGPQQRKVIETVRAMIDNDAALAVMGNHEFNAICFHTNVPGSSSKYLRSRSDKNINQHKEFLDEYINTPDDLSDVIEWFKRLPLWLDIEGAEQERLRVIHACWDKKAINMLRDSYCNNNGEINKEQRVQFFVDASIDDSKAYNSIETLIKGKEISLPDGHEGIRDKQGIVRKEIRVKWWIKDARTFSDIYFGHNEDDKGPESLADLKDPINYHVPYSSSEPVLFVGHYWQNADKPKKLHQNIVCVDYSIAKSGKLVAYQWDNECDIADEYFNWVGK